MSMERNPMTLVEVKKNGSRVLTRLLKSFSLASLMAAGAMNVGCTSLTQPLAGIPVRRLPPQFLAQSKSNLVPLDPSRLSQEPPRQYLLDEGDILGIYIEGVLPYTPTDKPPEPPPVNFPPEGSTLDPSLGYPVVIQENGTISLPSIDPLKVKGLTVAQVTNLIRKAYLEANIFSNEAKLHPIVTMLKERQYNVVVVRQDVGSPQQQQLLQQQGGTRGNYLRGSDQSAAGSMIKLDAYKNDVLHALMASGGLPGVNAKNEVKILRAGKANQKKRDEFIQQFYARYHNNPDTCGCPPPLPDDPSVLKIPMRLPAGVIPSFQTEDIILQEGDVVYIESREAEVFYTGGLLPGGEYLIPRDYDLDVLGAMGLAGQGVGSRTGGSGGGGGSFGIQQYTIPPSDLFILRKTPCNGQITIQVDLTRAALDPRERPLIMPGDTLILRYKPCEEAVNFGTFAFFTYGITQLFQGRR